MTREFADEATDALGDLAEESTNANLFWFYAVKAVASALLAIVQSINLLRQEIGDKR